MTVHAPQLMAVEDNDEMYSLIKDEYAPLHQARASIDEDCEEEEEGLDDAEDGEDEPEDTADGLPEVQSLSSDAAPLTRPATAPAGPAQAQSVAAPSLVVNVLLTSSLSINHDPQQGEEETADEGIAHNRMTGTESVDSACWHSQRQQQVQSFRNLSAVLSQRKVLLSPSATPASVSDVTATTAIPGISGLSSLQRPTTAPVPLLLLEGNGDGITTPQRGRQMGSMHHRRHHRGGGGSGSSSMWSSVGSGRSLAVNLRETAGVGSGGGDIDLEATAHALPPLPGAYVPTSGAAGVAVYVHNSSNDNMISSSIHPQYAAPAAGSANVIDADDETDGVPVVVSMGGCRGMPIRRGSGPVQPPPSPATTIGSGSASSGSSRSASSGSSHSASITSAWSSLRQGQGDGPASEPSLAAAGGGAAVDGATPDPPALVVLSTTAERQISRARKSSINVTTRLIEIRGLSERTEEAPPDSTGDANDGSDASAGQGEESMAVPEATKSKLRPLNTNSASPSSPALTTTSRRSAGLSTSLTSAAAGPSISASGGRILASAVTAVGGVARGLAVTPVAVVGRGFRKLSDFATGDGAYVSVRHLDVLSAEDAVAKARASFNDTPQLPTPHFSSGLSGNVSGGSSAAAKRRSRSGSRGALVYTLPAVIPFSNTSSSSAVPHSGGHRTRLSLSLGPGVRRMGASDNARMSPPLTSNPCNGQTASFSPSASAAAVASDRSSTDPEVTRHSRQRSNSSNDACRTRLRGGHGRHLTAPIFPLAPEADLVDFGAARIRFPQQDEARLGLQAMYEREERSHQQQVRDMERVNKGSAAANAAAADGDGSTDDWPHSPTRPAPPTAAAVDATSDDSPPRPRRASDPAFVGLESSSGSADSGSGGSGMFDSGSADISSNQRLPAMEAVTAMYRMPLPPAVTVPSSNIDVSGSANYTAAASTGSKRASDSSGSTGSRVNSLKSAQAYSAIATSQVASEAMLQSLQPAAPLMRADPASVPAYSMTAPSRRPRLSSDFNRPFQQHVMQLQAAMGGANISDAPSSLQPLSLLVYQGGHLSLLGAEPNRGVYAKGAQSAAVSPSSSAPALWGHAFLPRRKGVFHASLGVKLRQASNKAINNRPQQPLAVGSPGSGSAINGSVDGSVNGSGAEGTTGSSSNSSNSGPGALGPAIAGLFWRASSSTAGNASEQNGSSGLTSGSATASSDGPQQQELQQQEADSIDALGSASQPPPQALSPVSASAPASASASAEGSTVGSRYHGDSGSGSCSSGGGGHMRTAAFACDGRPCSEWALPFRFTRLLQGRKLNALVS